MLSLDAGMLLSMIAAHPPLFFLAVVALSFLLEDATTIAAGALASQMRVDPVLALSAVLLGTIAGDLLLHGAGRVAGRLAFVGRRLASHGVLISAGRSATLVAAARFVPGLRLPAYAGSGIARMPFPRFAAIVVLTGLVWTPLLFHAGRILSGSVAGLVLLAVAAAVLLAPRLLKRPLHKLLASA